MILSADKYRIERSGVLGKIQGVALHALEIQDPSKEDYINQFSLIIELFKEYDRLSELYLEGLEKS